VPTFAERGCGVVSAMDPYSRILGFLDRKADDLALQKITVEETIEMKKKNSMV
jgi:hypothetical protein